jgi:peptidoglycan/LPS O-acetylase OafA/YrhL
MTTLHNHTGTAGETRGTGGTGGTGDGGGTGMVGRGLNALGTFLVVLPLLGGVAGLLLALTGRFGGPENALTAAWYIPAALAVSAVVGALILLVLHRRERVVRSIALWSALSAAGWVFAMGSAQVTGLADSDAIENATLAKGLLLFGVAVYLLGLMGLTAAGVRAGRPPEDDWY